MEINHTLFKKILLYLIVIILLYLVIDGVNLYPIKSIEDSNKKIIAQNNFNSYQSELTKKSGNTTIYVYRKNGNVLFLNYLKSNVFNKYKLSSQFITKDKSLIGTVATEQFLVKLIHVSKEDILIKTVGKTETIKFFFYSIIIKLVIALYKMIRKKLQCWYYLSYLKISMLEFLF